MNISEQIKPFEQLCKKQVFGSKNRYINTVKESEWKPSEHPNCSDNKFIVDNESEYILEIYASTYAYEKQCTTSKSAEEKFTVTSNCNNNERKITFLLH